jgi:hypothetical protein
VWQQKILLPIYLLLQLVSGFGGSAYSSTSQVLNIITSKVIYLASPKSTLSLAQKQKKCGTTTKEVSTMRKHKAVSSSFFNPKMCPLQNPRSKMKAHW